MLEQELEHLEEPHEDEELEDGVDWQVEVNVHGLAVGGIPEVSPSHKARVVHVQLLTSNQTEDEVDVGGQRDHLEQGQN